MQQSPGPSLLSPPLHSVPEMNRGRKRQEERMDSFRELPRPPLCAALQQHQDSRDELKNAAVTLPDPVCPSLLPLCRLVAEGPGKEGARRRAESQRRCSAAAASHGSAAPAGWSRDPRSGGAQAGWRMVGGSTPGGGRRDNGAEPAVEKARVCPSLHTEE